MAKTGSKEADSGGRSSFLATFEIEDPGPVPLGMDLSQKDASISWDRVLREEKDCMEKMQQRRPAESRGEQRFSVALSGGGIRAAAFQAGVLWRLAERGLLKDVDYMAAVSGGGYVASSFVSYCLAAGVPNPGHVKEWYLRVIAKVIVRMQENAGNFVRDAVRTPGCPADGAGCLPRIFDFPVLLITLIFTLSINPLMFLVACLSPFTIAVELFFGAGMRAAFCTTTDDWVRVFLRWSPVWKFSIFTCVMAVLTFVSFIATKCLPCCRLRRDERGDLRAGYGFLMGHALNAFLVRFDAVLFTLMAFLFFTPYFYISMYSWRSTALALKHAACRSFVFMHREHGQRHCSNTYHTMFWYNDPIFELPINYTAEAALQDRRFVAGAEDSDVFLERQQVTIGVVRFFFLGVMVVIAMSVLLAPIVGHQVMIFIVSVAGPLGLFVFTVYYSQMAVFGPIYDGTVGLKRYDGKSYHVFQMWSLCSSLVVLPLYPFIRSVMHLYYKRTLQTNFFAGGKDCRHADVASHPFCPFLLLTGTASGYQPPGDDDNICELSFSPLHVGGDETGYLRTPKSRSLAKVAALSGAGCLDALCLTMADALTLRFWLEVLNLTWGDYILFDRQPMRIIKILASRGKGMEVYIDRFLHFLPCGLTWTMIYSLFLGGYYIGYHHENTVTSCRIEKGLVLTALFTFSLMLLLSFIPIEPFHDFLASDPLLREIQQATHYFHVGNRPPRMLYITDGGVKDCTGILPLMRRRCRRILLILAAADPDDELGVLRAALESAVEEKVGSFYNPQAPGEHINVLFEKFQGDRRMMYLHLGICYSWDDPDEPRTADLFVVKNRLPPSLEAEPIQPLLTEEEILGGSPGRPPEGQRWGNLTTDQLGPCGCCDCCHTRGMNCGRKFPHGSAAGYMWLSPQWCNSLARLGHRVSADVAEAVAAPIFAETSMTPEQFGRKTQHQRASSTPMRGSEAPAQFTLTASMPLLRRMDSPDAERGSATRIGW